MSGRPRLGVLLSGGGRTLMNLVEHIERGSLVADVGVVIASRECPGAEWARGRGLPTLLMRGVVPRATLGRVLADHGVAWGVLAGYLNLVEIPAGFEQRMTNIHPALLPAFGGAGLYGERVHAAVLAAGCKVSGCTVHLIDERYDTGPILAQAACPVQDDDTVKSLAARVFALECDLYPATLRRLLGGRVVVDGRRAAIVPA